MEIQEVSLCILCTELQSNLAQWEQIHLWIKKLIYKKQVSYANDIIYISMPVETL